VSWLFLADVETGRRLANILGLDRPHSILYRQDVNRLYVVEGTEVAGPLRVFDAKSYGEIGKVTLCPGANWIAYDSAMQYLYVTHSGDIVKHEYCIISVLDINKFQKLHDIKIEGDILEELEDIALEASTSKMYVGIKPKNEVAVIDRKTQALSMALETRELGGPLVLDEINHRLFVGCRNGEIVVLDTTTGKELPALPINVGIRDMTFDSVSKRIYANCGGPPKEGNGSVDIYEQVDPEHYKSLGSVGTGPAARNGILDGRASRYFVGIPGQGTNDAQIFVFEVQ
jgi:DNA-binding beta-propeller fold protein YncE